MGAVGDSTSAAMTTGCGRRVGVARFRLPVVRSIDRVVLRVDAAGDSGETVWVSMTAAEALRLAAALVAQARSLSPRPGRTPA